LVGEKKEVLFAKFSVSVTRKAKIEAWESIRQRLLENGADEAEATVAQLRDVIWPNLKRCATVKASDEAKTGAPGGKITQIEEAVLNVLGREFALLKPVDVMDTQVNIGCDGDQDGAVVERVATEQSTERKRKRQDTEEKDEMARELGKLRIRTLKLDCTNLKLQNIKLRLEIKQLRQNSVVHNVPISMDAPFSLQE